MPTTALVDLVRQETNPSLTVLTEYLIFRNDWKSSEQFRKLLSVRGVHSALLRGFGSERSEATVRIGGVPVDNLPTERVPGIALDTSLYANRVYVASTEGLFESYFNPADPRIQYPLIQRLEVRTAKVAARYLSLNASTEDEGLWFAPILIGQGYWDEWPPQSRDLNMDRVAEYSLAASFASRHLLNYKNSPTPGFLRAEAVRERAHDRAAYDEWRVVNYEAERDIERLALHALMHQDKARLSLVEKDRDPLPDERPVVLGNSGYRLLLNWQDESHVIDISAFQGKDIEARPDRRFGRAQLPHASPEEVLAVYPMAAGFLVELLDEVRLLTPNGSYLLFEGSAARVRTFPHSRRYQDVALIVGEDGCHLVGFLES